MSADLERLQQRRLVFVRNRHLFLTARAVAMLCGMSETELKARMPRFPWGMAPGQTVATSFPPDLVADMKTGMEHTVMLTGRHDLLGALAMLAQTGR